jgi:two-component system, chemotaxis family, chemotaxis protein CheY
MAKTVLIVDDVAFVRKTLASIFTAAHYQVVGEAADGAEAIQLYIKLRPDLVTMDVVMPQMSGIDATRKILSLDPNGKVVIISAMGQESLIMEAINVGAKDYILKPFSAQDILRTVERVLASDNHPQGRGTHRETRTG